MFQRGKLIAMCTQENAAACIVGRAAMSSADMLLRPALVLYLTKIFSSAVSLNQLIIFVLVLFSEVCVWKLYMFLVTYCVRITSLAK